MSSSSPIILETLDSDEDPDIKDNKKAMQAQSVRGGQKDRTSNTLHQTQSARDGQVILHQ